MGCPPREVFFLSSFDRTLPRRVVVRWWSDVSLQEPGVKFGHGGQAPEDPRDNKLPGNPPWRAGYLGGPRAYLVILEAGVLTKPMTTSDWVDELPTRVSARRSCWLQVTWLPFLNIFLFEKPARDQKSQQRF